MAAGKTLKFRSAEKIRVLVADDEGQNSRRLMEFLNQNGFECRITSNGNDAKKIISGWNPRIVLIDLLLPEVNAFGVLNFIQSEPNIRKRDMAVLVMSGHNSEENVKESYRRGARDYIARPFMYNDLLARVVFHCRDQRAFEKDTRDANHDAMKIADLLVTQALQNEPYETVLYNLTKMATLRLKGLRCSIVRQMTFENGIVLASNDKQDIAGFALDLKKYPEIQLCVNTGKIIVIDDIGESKALSKIKGVLKEIQFNSLLVCPIYYRHKVFGVISMRMPLDRHRLEEHEVRFLEYASKIISLYISTLSPADLGRYGVIAA